MSGTGALRRDLIVMCRLVAVLAVVTLAVTSGERTRGAAAVGTQAAASEPRLLTFSRTLTAADYERLLEQPFEVSPGTRRVEVSYRVSGGEARTVVDLGLRGPSGLRGWSGGARSTIWVSALGASQGYLPGAIEPGAWAVVLGVPNIRQGRIDTLNIDVRLFDSDLPEGGAIAGRTPGWFVGDLHAHTGHSDGRARSRRGRPVGTPPHRLADAAVAAGLDFIAVTDHNTASHWLDIDRLQPFYDDLLLLRGREVTTYRGHANTVGERTFAEFRLSSPDASSAALLAPIADAGAFVSINHPALPDGEVCMGCGWNDTSAAVMRSVHGVEVVNGDAASGPLSGWAFWARLLSAGHRLTAVGGSDEHTVDDDADRRLGRPATVVWAQTLSETAIVAGLKSGRAYVRVRGPAGPTLVEFHAEQAGRRYEMGDTAPPSTATRLVAQVQGAEGQTLQWIVDGAMVAQATLGTAPVTLESPATTSARWIAIVVRDATGPTLMSNAVYLSRP